MSQSLTTAETRTNVSTTHRRYIANVRFCPHLGIAQVKICTKTGYALSSGTDADVHVRLIGPTGCYIPYVNLENPGDDFELGAYDCFDYNTTSVGHEVREIYIRQARRPEYWCLRYVDLCCYQGTGPPQSPQRFQGPGFFKDTLIKSLKRIKSSAVTGVCRSASPVRVTENVLQTLLFVLLAQTILTISV